MNITGHTREATFMSYIGNDPNRDALADRFMEGIRNISSQKILFNLFYIYLDIICCCYERTKRKNLCQYPRIGHQIQNRNLSYPKAARRQRTNDGVV